MGMSSTSFTADPVQEAEVATPPLGSTQQDVVMSEPFVDQIPSSEVTNGATQGGGLVVKKIFSLWINYCLYNP